MKLKHAIKPIVFRLHSYFVVAVPSTEKDFSVYLFAFRTKIKYVANVMAFIFLLPCQCCVMHTP